MSNMCKTIDSTPLPGEEKHGGGRPHCCHVEGLQVVDDVAEHVETLLDGELEGEVSGAEEGGDVLGSLDVGENVDYRE